MFGKEDDGQTDSISVDPSAEPTEVEISTQPAEPEAIVPTATVDVLVQTPTPVLVVTGNEDTQTPEPSPTRFPTPTPESDLTTVAIARTLEQSIQIATESSRIQTSCSSIVDQDVNKVLCLPKEILQELIDIDGVLDNAPNLVGTDQHDTILVRPDKVLGYVLRPNISIRGYVIDPAAQFNIDPPLFYMPAEAELSETMLRYLETQVLHSFTYTTNEQAFRTTVPKVESEDKILLVGDSILFGVGVNDESTIASQLQALVGNSMQVINGGIGGYNDDEAFAYADMLTATENYSALVYVASNFDFREGETLTGKGESSVKRLATLKDRVEGPVMLMLMPNLEYALYRLYEGLPGFWTREMDTFRVNLHSWTKDAGVDYIDFIEEVDEFGQRSETVFATFALYVDHTHFSPLGNRLAAERLYAALVGLGVTPN